MFVKNPAKFDCNRFQISPAMFVLFLLRNLHSRFPASNLIGLLLLQIFSVLLQIFPVVKDFCTVVTDFCTFATDFCTVVTDFALIFAALIRIFALLFGINYSGPCNIISMGNSHISQLRNVGNSHVR